MTAQHADPAEANGACSARAVGHPVGGGYADVLERLFAAYEAEHTLVTIETVTAKARADLQGQIHSESQAEMLERLARARLDALDRTRP